MSSETRKVYALICTFGGAITGGFAGVIWIDGVRHTFTGIDFQAFTIAGLIASCLMASAASLNLRDEDAPGLGVIWSFASFPGLAGPLLCGFLSIMQLGFGALGIVGLLIIPFAIIPKLMGLEFDEIMPRSRFDHDDIGDLW